MSVLPLAEATGGSFTEHLLDPDGELPAIDLP